MSVKAQLAMKTVQSFCVLLFVTFETSRCVIVGDGRNRVLTDMSDKNITAFIAASTTELYNDKPSALETRTWTRNGTLSRSSGTNNDIWKFSAQFTSRVQTSQFLGESARMTHINTSSETIRQTDPHTGVSESKWSILIHSGSETQILNTRNTTRELSTSKSRHDTATYTSKEHLISSSPAVEFSSQFTQSDNYYKTPSLALGSLMGTYSTTRAQPSAMFNSMTTTTHSVQISSPSNPGRSEEPDLYHTSGFSNVVRTTRIHESAKQTTTAGVIHTSPSLPRSVVIAKSEGNVSGYPYLTSRHYSPILTTQILKTFQQITTSASRYRGSMSAAYHTSGVEIHSTTFSSRLEDNTASRFGLSVASQSTILTTTGNISQTTEPEIKTSRVIAASQSWSATSRVVQRSEGTRNPGKSSVLTSQHPWQSGKSHEVFSTGRNHETSTQELYLSSIHSFTSEKHFTKVQLKSSAYVPITPSNGVNVVPADFMKDNKMVVYFLATCLPLAFLLGFIMAIVYFKRSRQDNTPQYSVTVEITDKTDHEMKRMYSIIDINAANINKEFWTGLKNNENSRSSILDLTSVKPAT